MLLISALIISSVSPLFSVVYRGVYGTTEQGKCNSKDQKGRSIPWDRQVTLLAEPTFCFSCKRFVNFCKEKYEKLARPG